MSGILLLVFGSFSDLSSHMDNADITVFLTTALTSREQMLLQHHETDMGEVSKGLERWRGRNNSSESLPILLS